jgi:hypothetical protein
MRIDSTDINKHSKPLLLNYQQTIMEVYIASKETVRASEESRS